MIDVDVDVDFPFDLFPRDKIGSCMELISIFYIQRSLCGEILCHLFHSF
jgi:hypothetical protein